MLKVRLLRDPRRRILTAQISCGIAAYLQIASVSASQEIVPITASRFLAQGTETQVDLALPALTERLIFLASAAPFDARALEQRLGMPLSADAGKPAPSKDKAEPAKSPSPDKDKQEDKSKPDKKEPPEPQDRPLDQRPGVLVADYVGSFASDGSALIDVPLEG